MLNAKGPIVKYNINFFVLSVDLQYSLIFGKKKTEKKVYLRISMLMADFDPTIMSQMQNTRIYCLFLHNVIVYSTINKIDEH